MEDNSQELKEEKKRVRRTKEQIEADKANAPADKLPTRKKRVKKTTKATRNVKLVPGNYDDSYMITEKQREDCYVYAVKRVMFDSVLGRADEKKEQILCFRQSQVHKTAIWENGEIVINTRERQLKIEYGAANVKLVNDPYEYE